MASGEQPPSGIGVYKMLVTRNKCSRGRQTERETVREEERVGEWESASRLHILKWKLARRTFYINVALKCAFCHNRAREREGEGEGVSKRQREEQVQS